MNDLMFVIFSILGFKNFSINCINSITDFDDENIIISLFTLAFYSVSDYF